MNVELALSIATQIINNFANHQSPLQEFEVLAYVQACRASEVILRDFREAWESSDATNSSECTNCQRGVPPNIS